MNKALFLDRDGTLIEYKPYLHKPEDVALLPGTIEALRRAQAGGFKLFLFTNQSGVGRGYFTLEDVHQVHLRLLELIGLGSSLFTEICIAPEHPSRPSDYRKPSPRFILEMIDRYALLPHKCWMIGDSRSDWEAGRAARTSVAAIRSSLLTAESVRQADAWNIPIYPNLVQFMTALDTSAT